MRTIRIATRASRLALIQAREVASRLESAGHPIEIVTISTRGDRDRDRSLVAIGGDGIFVKELESSMLEGRADVAVHSMKDLPTETQAALRNAAVLEREDPRDVLVSKDNAYRSLDELPRGTSVGTSSLRRRALVIAVRPDLDLRDIRGNVDSRVRKVIDGEYGAAILALAGLRRAGLLESVGGGAPLPVDMVTPAPAQGAICAQCRADDREMLEALERLNHGPTMLEVAMERAFLRRMGGGCLVPIGACARVRDGRYAIVAVVAAVDGTALVRRSAQGDVRDEESAAAAAERLADEMLDAGGRALVEKFRAALARGL